MKEQTWDKNDVRYNKDGYFNLTGYMSLCDKDWENKDISFIFNAGRNMGKSYGTWEHIEKEIWEKYNYQKRIVYLRTNLTKLKKARESFNAKYNGKYYMSENKIYKVEYDEDGKELKANRLEIGSVCGVNNAENYKSGWFENYCCIFWDEYNEECNDIGLWKKWIDLFKTIKRNNTPFLCLLIGNKVDGDNDILVNLRIDLEEIDSDGSNDYHIEKRGNIHFIDIGNDTFKHLGQEQDMVNIWASYDKKTDRYLNGGGYLNKRSGDVLIYDYKIEPTKEIKFYIAYADYLFEYGTFERGIYFHMIEYDEKLPGYKTLALNNLADMRFDDAVKYYDENDYKDFATLLKIKSKNKQLYYSTNEAKQILDNYIITITSLI